MLIYTRHIYIIYIYIWIYTYIFLLFICHKLNVIWSCIDERVLYKGYFFFYISSHGFSRGRNRPLFFFCRRAGVSLSPPPPPLSIITLTPSCLSISVIAAVFFGMWLLHVCVLWNLISPWLRVDVQHKARSQQLRPLPPAERQKLGMIERTEQVSIPASFSKPSRTLKKKLNPTIPFFFLFRCTSWSSKNHKSVLTFCVDLKKTRKASVGPRRTFWSIVWNAL